MRIALGSDHVGIELKKLIKEHLQEKGYEMEDCGTDSSEATDYPDFALAVAKAVLAGKSQMGILICGTGIGMCIAANKIKGIRAALCQETYSARMSREHNNANILCLGQRVMGSKLALEVVDAWLEADYSPEGRHQQRLDKIAGFEGGEAF